MGKLTDEQIAICRQMGVAPEDYQKTLEAEGRQGIATANLSNIDLSICRQMGIDPKDYVKAG